MAPRSELNPFRALAALAAVLLCSAAYAGETDKVATQPTPPFAVTTQAGTTTPAKTATPTTQAAKKTTTASPTTAGKPTATVTKTTTMTSPTSVADAKRDAAKRRQVKPVMTTANAANIKQAYPWTTGTKPQAPPAKATASAPFKDVKTGAIQSPGYAVSVTAPRKATPATVAPKTATTTTTSTVKPTTSTTTSTAKPTAPATTSASFKERMSRTTVTPPVMTSGAKASNTTPVKATVPMKATPVAPKLAAAPARPKSPPKGAKPDWTFRQVVASSSSSAKIVGGVSLATKPTADWTKDKPAATTTTTTTAKAPGSTPAPTVSAKTSTATKTSVVATAKPGAAFKGVQAGSATSVAAKGAAPATKGSMENPQAAKPGAPLTTSVQNLGARFMEQREQYVYNSLNRRDPFASLVSGSFEGEVGTPLLDVSSMKLVGIVWGASDKFALVEDGHGHGFVLRVGDPVLNGYIAGLTKQELIVKQSSYGDTQTVTIQLQRKEGASNAQ